MAVIPQGYYDANSFDEGIEYDFAYYVAADGDPGPNNLPETSVGTAVSLEPMAISFNGISLGEETYLFGYPADQDNNVDGAKLMFSHDIAVSANQYTEGDGYYLPCNGLSGGASGGPWTQSDPATGYLTLQSVNSWGWVDETRTGMGAPPYTNGAECVYNAANTEDLSSGDIVVIC